MIIQGTNESLILEFDENMESIQQINIALYARSSLLKKWNIEDVIISGNEVYAPISQQESMNFISGGCTLEVKYKDAYGNVINCNNSRVPVVKRNDKTVM